MSLDECFYQFQKWKGEVAEGYVADFLGAKYKEEYVVGFTSGTRTPSRFQESTYPGLTEEYFEWVDLLESVLGSGTEFVMMELGAGFGRWSVNGALAAKQRGKEYRIIAIEAEPTHFKWLKENIAGNELDLSRCELVEAAVSARKGEAEFYIGDATSWYGQQLRADYKPLLTEDMKQKGVVFGIVKTVVLDEYLDRYDCVDLIDMDVQGSELDVLSASQEMVNKKVKRVHIGTHSHDIEKGLRDLFRKLSWESHFDFECLGERKTPRGVANFGDGVQSWVNPAFKK